MPVEMEDQARLVCSGPCLSQTPKINQKTFLLLFTVNFFKQVIYTLLFFLNKNVQTEYFLTEFHSISDDWLIFIFFYDFFLWSRDHGNALLCHRITPDLMNQMN